MLRPLCLVPSTGEQKSDITDIMSPVARKRADSLVFSITSQKYYSPRQSMLMDSKQHEVSRQLQTLHLKLENLESRVERIDSESVVDNIFLPKQNRKIQANVCSQNHKNPLFLNQDSNKYANATKIGKIIKKEKDLSKTTKFQRLDQNKQSIDHFTVQSRHSMITEDSQMIGKIKELSHLKKQVNAMKHTIEKNKRSKSITSERLSASKDLIKNLKKDQKKANRIVDKLRSDLKRSENIRENKNRSSRSSKMKSITTARPSKCNFVQDDGNWLTYILYFTLLNFTLAMFLGLQINQSLSHHHHFSATSFFLTTLDLALTKL